MKKSFLLLPFFLMLLSAAPTLLTGKIIGVSDGDTVTLLTTDKKQIMDVYLSTLI